MNFIHEKLELISKIVISLQFQKFDDCIMAVRLKKLNFSIVSKVLGCLLIFEGVLMSMSLIISAIFGDHSLNINYLFNPKYDFCAIFVSVVITIVVGLLLLFCFKSNEATMSKREGFLIVVMSWIFMSFFGALPFIFNGILPSFTDAFMESMSGFTTTGLTTIGDVDNTAKGILFWRGTTHFIGGMGIILFSIVLLPLLGVGGYLLMTVESTGLIPTKLHPRIKETAKRLLAIYLILNIVCTFSLMLAGMNWFDAIVHAFGAIATGGFSNYNSSAQYFKPAIQYVLIFFMLISSMSFVSLYYFFTFNIKKGKKHEETKAFLVVVLASTIYIFVSLLASPASDGKSIEEIFRTSLFQVSSIISTTGYVSSNYLTWPSYIWFILFLLMFVGGCSGSTSGGIKIFRYVMLIKNCKLEIKRQIHPQAVLPVKFNGDRVSSNTIHNVQAFFVFYLLVFVVGAVLLSMLGIDFETSIGASITALGNIGPAIGKVGPVDNYVLFPKLGKWIISILMLLGRLELFPVLIIFNGSFWEK